jgi:hypothetical protein
MEHLSGRGGEIDNLALHAFGLGGDLCVWRLFLQSDPTFSCEFAMRVTSQTQ